MKKQILLITLLVYGVDTFAQKCKDVNVSFAVASPSGFSKGNKKFTYSTNSTHLRIPNSIAYGNIGKHKFQYTQPTWTPSTELKQKIMALNSYEYKATKSDFFIKIIIDQISVNGISTSGKINTWNVSSKYVLKLEGDFVIFDKPNGEELQKIPLTGIALLDIKDNFEAKTIDEVHAMFGDYLDKDKKVNTLNYDEAVISAMRNAEINAFMPGYQIFGNSKFSFLKEFSELDFETYKNYAKTIQNCEDKRLCVAGSSSSPSLGGLSGLSSALEARRASKPACIVYPDLQDCYKKNENIFATYLTDYAKYKNHANSEVKTAIHTNAFYALVYYKKYDSALMLSKDLGDNTDKWYIKEITKNLEVYKTQMDRIFEFDPTLSFEKANLPKVIEMENKITQVIQEEKEAEFKNKFMAGSFIDKNGAQYNGLIYYNPYTIKFKEKKYNDIRHNVMYFLCASGQDCKEYKSTDNSAMPISAALVKEMTINGTKYISKDVLVKGLLKSYKNFLYSIKENDKFGFYERYANEDASIIEYVYWIKSNENPIAEDVSEGKLLEYFKEYPKVIEAIKSKKSAKEIAETMF